MPKSIIGSLFVVIALISNSASSISLSINVEHDMSAPTYGLQQPTSSQLTYDPQHGLNMKGTINDILGPPIKIANGFNHMLAGSTMTGAGSGLKAGGAILGFDSKLLEAAGGANILRGGLLLGHAAGHKALATAVGGLPGKKIASIIEVPVKVVAMKDIAAGGLLKGAGAIKGLEAVSKMGKGKAMMEQGGALKKEGLNEVMEGVSEGMQNIGHMVQQTTNNAQTAFKFLPLVLDMEQQQSKEGATKSAAGDHQQQQQHYPEPSSAKQASGAPITGGSMFGGLTSLLPGVGSNPDPLSGLFGGFGSGIGSGSGSHHHGGYAAMLNSTSPLTNLLMNPNLNPFLLPLSSGGPLAQALAGKGIGGDSLLSHQLNQPQQQQQQVQLQQQHLQQHQQQYPEIKP